MKVITETTSYCNNLYQVRRVSDKVILGTRRTWWRLLQKHVVPNDEGTLLQKRRVSDEYSQDTSYLMKVITETSGTTCFWWRLLQKHVVPHQEGYYRNTSYLMEKHVVPETCRTLKVRRRFCNNYRYDVVPDEPSSETRVSYLTKVITGTRRT